MTNHPDFPILTAEFLEHRRRVSEFLDAHNGVTHPNQNCPSETPVDPRVALLFPPEPPVRPEEDPELGEETERFLVPKTAVTYVNPATTCDIDPEIAQVAPYRRRCPKCGVGAAEECAGNMPIPLYWRSENSVAPIPADPKRFASQASGLAQACLDAMERQNWAGFTGVEQHIAYTAAQRTFSDDLLKSRHSSGKSWKAIAKQSKRSAETVERLYHEAVDELARRLASSLHQCCPVCREKYPEVISDPFIRCDQCRSELAVRSITGLWRPVNPGVTIRLEASYRVLGVEPTESYEAIKASYQGLIAKDPDQATHKAWTMIHLHRSLHGDNARALRRTIPLCLPPHF